MLRALQFTLTTEGRDGSAGRNLWHSRDTAHNDINPSILFWESPDPRRDCCPLGTRHLAPGRSVRRWTLTCIFVPRATDNVHSSNQAIRAHDSQFSNPRGFAPEHGALPGSKVD